jgi:protein-S-isoprenylcysteine O-methyltransferase Ste14
MNIVQVSIISSWVILLLYWVVSAFFQKRVAEKPNYVNSFFYAMLILIPVILLVKSDIFAPLAIVIVRQSLVIDIISVALCVIGLICAIWARTVLAGNWSARVVFKKNHELVEKGPYRVIRHPIYTGFILMYLGTALAVGRISGVVGFIILFVGSWLKLKQEEKLMIKHFGKKYIEYKKRTKALIPYVI